MHLPTGFFSLEDIVRLLIDEFGIVPQRDDWREIIVTNQGASPGI
jgi:hypothetical protein